MPIENNQTYEKREGKEYPSIPKGIYQVELLDVKAVQNETYNSKMGKTNGVKEYQTDLAWQFTILSGRDEAQEKEENKELRGRNIWENFGNSYLWIGKNGKNNLYRIVEAFLGKELNQKEEAEGINSDLLNTFIGQQINLSIEPKTSKTGKIFDNIVDYFKMSNKIQGLTREEKENATVKTDSRDKAHQQAPVVAEQPSNQEPPTAEQISF